MQTWIFPKPPGSFFMHQLISSDICANLLGWCGIFEFHCLDDNCLGEPSEFGVRFFSFFQSLLQKQRRFVLAQQTCISVNIPVACHFVMFGTPGRGDQPNVQFLGFPMVGKAKSKESSFFFEKSTVNTGLGFGSVILPPHHVTSRIASLPFRSPCPVSARIARETWPDRLSQVSEHGKTNGAEEGIGRPFNRKENAPPAGWWSRATGSTGSLGSLTVRVQQFDVSCADQQVRETGHAFSPGVWPSYLPFCHGPTLDHVFCCYDYRAI